jgi:adenylate kinase
MQLILLGPPGVGKGTQAERLAESYRIAHISTGEMFRDAVAKGLELGKQANKYMAAGELVPDEIVIGMVEERLSRPDTAAGFLLDGFPRTTAQAEALDALLKRIGRPITAVVDLRADPEVLVKRLSGRRVCTKCGATYHVDNMPPAKEGVCDQCGGAVQQRKDDQPEAVRTRLVEYQSKTASLTDYYQKTGLLEAVDASGPVDEVLSVIQSLIGGRL